jgi:hypothetical protein
MKNYYQHNKIMNRITGYILLNHKQNKSTIKETQKHPARCLITNARKHIPTNLAAFLMSSWLFQESHPLY